MTDYVKGTNFTALRGTTPADPAIFDTEFASVASASATKMDKTGGAFTGAVALPADTSTTSGAGGPSNNAVPMEHIYMHAFPTGTRMFFNQATAPLGWTIDNAIQNDSMLRVVRVFDSAAGGKGGNMSPINGLTATQGHALTINEMPAHTHTVTANFTQAGGPTVGALQAGATVRQQDQATTSTGGGAAHTHPITFTPRYVEAIVCVKD